MNYLLERKKTEGRDPTNDGRADEYSQAILFFSRMQQGFYGSKKKEDGEAALIYKGWRRRFRFRERPLMWPYLE